MGIIAGILLFKTSVVEMPTICGDGLENIIKEIGEQGLSVEGRLFEGSKGGRGK